MVRVAAGPAADRGLDRIDQPLARAASPDRRTSATGCATPPWPRRSSATGPARERSRRRARRHAADGPPKNTGFRDGGRGRSHRCRRDLHDVDGRASTPVFSPRAGRRRARRRTPQLLDTAAEQGCITFAFGVGAAFKAPSQDNTAAEPARLPAAGEAGRAGPASTRRRSCGSTREQRLPGVGVAPAGPGLPVGPRDRTPGCSGSTSTSAYIHSKFMLIDPLGADPIVVTGSANFSVASTKENDENMLIVRGDRRVADIYFTEFNRLFNHYYFRSVIEDPSRRPALARAGRALASWTRPRAGRRSTRPARSAPSTSRSSRPWRTPSCSR